MNNIFIIMYVVLFAILELGTTMIVNLEVNFLLWYFFIVLIVFILIAPLLLMHTLVDYHYYDDNHRESVKGLYKQYLNVSSRTTDSKMIDEEFKETNRNKDDKSE